MDNEPLDSWLSFLQEIAVAVTRPGNTYTSLQTIGIKLASLLQTQQTLIILRERDKVTLLTIRPSVQITHHTLENFPLFSTLLTTKEPLLHIELSRHKALEDALTAPYASLLSLFPIFTEGIVRGAIGLGTNSELNTTEISLIKTVSTLITFSLLPDKSTEQDALQKQLNRQANALKQQEQYLSLLDHITQVQIDSDMASALSEIAKRLGHLIEADGCYITLWDAEREQAIPLAAYGRVPSDYVEVELRPGERTLTQSVLEVGHTLVIKNLRDTPHLAPRLGDLFPSISALILPLYIDDEKLGAFIIAFNYPYTFSPDQIALYEQVASRIALTLSKIKLFDTTHRQLEELKVLQAIALACAEETDVDKLLYRVTNVIGDTLFPSNFGILLLNKSGDSLIPHRSYQLNEEPLDSIKIPIGSGIVGTVAKSGEPLRLDDVTTDARYLNMDPTTKSELCVPMKIGSRLIGVVNVESPQTNAFTDTDLRLLTTIANQIATALEKLRLFDETHRRASELALLNRLSQDFTASYAIQEISQLTVEHIREWFDYYNVGIATLTSDGEALMIQGMAGVYATSVLPVGSIVPKEKGIIGRVLVTGKAIVANDSQNHPDFYEFEGMVILSECAIPLKRQGEIFGVLNIDSNKRDTFTQSDFTLLQTIADQLSVTLEKTYLFEETRTRAAELTTLMDVSTALRLATTKRAMLESVLNQSVAAVKADLGTMLLQDRNKASQLIVEACYPPDLGMVGSQYPLDRGVSGHVFTEGDHYFSRNMRQDTKVYLEPQDRARLSKAQTLISLPLRTHEATVGVMHIVFHTMRELSDQEINLLLTMAEIAGSALHRTLVWEMLEERVAERTWDLAQANEQLQELDRLKSKFVSDVSHELRTPITNLGLYLDLIERGNSEKFAHYWKVVRQQSRRLKELIEDILSLSRLEAYQDSFELQTVNLNDLVHGVVLTHQAMAEARGLRLIFDPAGDLPPLLAEPDYINQVITNLVVNGLNYTLDGIVYLNTAYHGKYIILRVKDTGMGISEKDLPHLFQRFYRGHNATEVNTPGTGLGLAIVKEIVHLHNGTIDVDSVLGEGTEFIIRFPVTE